MNTLRQEVKQLATQLLNTDEKDIGLIKTRSDALINKISCMLNVDLSPSVFIDEGFTESEQGKACSPLVAAICAKEFMRNYQFQRGCLAAINAKASTKESPVKLLYAGTGPFGTIVIPLLLLLSPEQVQVSLLDIHQESLDTLMRLVKFLELEAFIEEVVLADASTWPGNGQAYDIIVSETMKAMLEQEPQLSVFNNLQNLLKADGILIPEEITIQAWLSDSQSEMNKMLGEKELMPNHLLGDVFRLNKDSLARYQTEKEIRGRIPVNTQLQPFNQIKYTTTIKVFNDIYLGENQCSLNLPTYKHIKSVQLKNCIEYHYLISQHPKFEFSYS